MNDGTEVEDFIIIPRNIPDWMNVSGKTLSGVPTWPNDIGEYNVSFDVDYIGSVSYTHLRAHET